MSNTNNLDLFVPALEQPAPRARKKRSFFLLDFLGSISSWFAEILPKAGPILAGSVLAAATIIASPASADNGYKAPAPAQNTIAPRDSRFGKDDGRVDDSSDALLGTRDPEKKHAKTRNTSHNLQTKPQPKKDPQNSVSTAQIMSELSLKNASAKVSAYVKPIAPASLKPTNTITTKPQSKWDWLCDTFSNFLVQLATTSPQRVLDKDMLAQGYRVDPDSGVLIIPENKYVKQGHKYVAVNYAPDYAINSVASGKQFKMEYQVSQTGGWGNAVKNTSFHI